MSAIRTILFATDFSEGAARACALAKTLTNLAQARLHVVHIVNEFHDKRTFRVSQDTMDRLMREIEEHAKDEIQKFCSTHLSDVQASTEIINGTPHEAIIQAAQRIDADLIIMGTHGRTGLEKMLVGSTAEKVVRSSPIPVLTVRQ
jgi:nucleotide-binding universal stress UspA family protein